MPDELCVVSFDNIEQAGWAGYQLTTFSQPLDEMVAAIISRLQDIDTDGNVYVANLSGHIFGIGGFIDIVNNVNKITFLGRKGKRKFNYSNNEWVCYKHNSNIDVEYIFH